MFYVKIYDSTTPHNSQIGTVPNAWCNECNKYTYHNSGGCTECSKKLKITDCVTIIKGARL
jgi:hypothetical protein